MSMQRGSGENCYAAFQICDVLRVLCFVVGCGAGRMVVT